MLDSKIDELLKELIDNAECSYNMDGENIQLKYSVLINHLKQMEKSLENDNKEPAVIPYFVADWIELLRQQLISYHFSSGARFLMYIGTDFNRLSLPKPIFDWITEGNETLLYNAIEYGYTVEETQITEKTMHEKLTSLLEELENEDNKQAFLKEFDSFMSKYSDQLKMHWR